MKSLIEFIKQEIEKENDFFKDNPSKDGFFYKRLNNIESYEKLNDYIFSKKQLYINSNNKDSFYVDLRKLTKKEYNKYINESLYSASIKDFIIALEKKYNKSIDDIEIIDGINDIERSGAIKIKFDKNILNDKELIEICKYYKYYISSINKNDIIFEPVNTKNITQIIKEKYHNKVYHLTKNENIESIKKHGLIVAGFANSNYDDIIWKISIEEYKNTFINLKDSIRKSIIKNLIYRNFSERVFVFYTNENINDTIEILGKTIDKGFNPSNYSVIEIDLKNHKIPFYHDSMMPINNQINYAYSTIDIPPSLISNIIKLK
ncbi:MAG: hypothetical protein J1F35_06500 [Erysipelotrichales bacterium]|nr:hypothetical protein [Erysipelotrichales bacterium]